MTKPKKQQSLDVKLMNFIRSNNINPDEFKVSDLVFILEEFDLSVESYLTLLSTTEKELEEEQKTNGGFIGIKHYHGCIGHIMLEKRFDEIID